MPNVAGGFEIAGGRGDLFGTKALADTGSD
jgi:hypothetical protein